jgi:geranylgeranyl reductase
MARTDVLVVGAGPAGIAAARELIGSGARVTLIDRHATPGGKPCGGGLTREAFELCGIDPASPRRSERAFDRLRVRGPTGRIELSHDRPLIVMVDRPSWTARELDALGAAGCEVRLGERLVDLGSGFATTSQGRIGFEFLVGADGSASRVRRLLGLERGPAMRAWQLRVDPSAPALAAIGADRPSVWFDPARFGSGYGWLFPAAGEVRVGCGAPLGALGSGRLKAGFRSWLGELGLAAVGGRAQCATIACGYLGHRFGPVRLAGDAAGLASPVTGEGIAQALISGREVAREILDPAYRSDVIPRLAARHRRTHDTLAHPRIGKALLGLAPLLLRLPGIRRAALRRFT